jgi:hypothetical protein
MTLTDLGIELQNLDGASAALSTYLNMTVNSTDFTTTNLNFGPNDPSGEWYCTGVSFVNSLIPSVSLLMPNPLSSMNQNNVTSMTQLIEKAQAGFGLISPVDRLDMMTPVLVFASIADSASTINTIGAEIVAEEQQAERDSEEMILGIFFDVLGWRMGRCGVIRCHQFCTTVCRDGT